MARKETKKEITDLVKNFSNFRVGDGLLNEDITPAEPKKEVKTKVNKHVELKPTSITNEVSIQERKALDDLRNARRGRKPAGAEKGNYKRVGFECRIDLLDQFDMIPYKTTKTRKELFEEALQYIIDKYGE